MFRNQYDQDVLTWSPQGRLHQVEYALEAVKQGGATVGCKNAEYVVLATLKRAASELSHHQQKIFKVDKSMGIAISGLTADGSLLSKYLRNECINHRFVYDSSLTVGRMATLVADKSQTCTQRYSLRPYGVGLLIAGADQTGCHLVQTCPSGNIYPFHAVAIGARSQACKTYLERTAANVKDNSLDELVIHALLALKEASSDNQLCTNNCSIAVVGVNKQFTILDEESTHAYLENMKLHGNGVDDNVL